ncbi:group XIIA secretory phospholipase A2 [Lingula anatina]|uniref:Group XIIA secretory phospholipase A2 n=1 Tax=Lingula anatina TaxID=7574 RepID=A0A1S3HJK8_LINAN|nr:group XIIA secretory phospholipase A2 [Lingula anatina]|eukprot:XP_013386303.1 group XIIA secretory phospholipase A2 [Lingula anatina]
MVDVMRKHASFLVILQIYIKLAISQSQGAFQLNADHVLDALDGIQDFLEGKGENCKFTCPRGQKQIPNPHHKVSFDGCGSLGIKVDTDHLPGVTSCCNNHDMCYDTCNKDREGCDRAFESCLADICKLFKREKMAFEGCKVTTQLLAAGASSMGCRSYRNAQAKACLCVPLDYHEEKRKEEL